MRKSISLFGILFLSYTTAHAFDLNQWLTSFGGSPVAVTPGQVAVVQRSAVDVYDLIPPGGVVTIPYGVNYFVQSIGSESSDPYIDYSWLDDSITINGTVIVPADPSKVVVITVPGVYYPFSSENIWAFYGAGIPYIEVYTFSGTPQQTQIKVQIIPPATALGGPDRYTLKAG